MDIIVYYGLLFLFYFANYFVITFFNTAVVSCALRSMTSGDPNLADGLGEAIARLPQIAGWALLSATVGTILRALEDRAEWAGRFAAGLLGMAWTVASYMVVPIIVVERKGPIASLTSSIELLRKTWGQQVVGGFSFGLVFAILGLPAVAAVIFSVATSYIPHPLACIAAAIAYLVVLSLVQSALHSIFQAALYLYARNSEAPPIGFSSELLAGAMQTK